ncbi:MAG: TetR/AcrR family transcriptional regulator [Eubacteriales bacterium]|nr:TetR/AcrR family transcriptional regulator [Eubacteriales bacterium]
MKNHRNLSRAVCRRTNIWEEWKKMKAMPTKERILYASLDLFSEKGYDGVGVDLIAENAGLKGPSLYRHFKGKEDIFHSLIDLVESHYEEGFGLKNTPEGFPDSMDELIEDALGKIQFTMHDDIVRKVRRILAMEQFRSERMAELATRYHLENLQRLYEAIFADMMEKGKMKQDDPECLALEFVSPVSLLIHVYDRQPEKEAEVLEEIRKHFQHFAKVYAKDS